MLLPDWFGQVHRWVHSDSGCITATPRWLYEARVLAFIRRQAPVRRI